MQQEPMFPVVVQAVAGENFTVYAYLLDGTVRKVDVLPLIQSGGVFEPLKNPVFFRDALTVLNDTVAWDFRTPRPDRLHRLRPVYNCRM